MPWYYVTDAVTNRHFLSTFFSSITIIKFKFNQLPTGLTLVGPELHLTTKHRDRKQLLGSCTAQKRQQPTCSSLACVLKLRPAPPVKQHDRNGTVPDNLWATPYTWQRHRRYSCGFMPHRYITSDPPPKFLHHRFLFFPPYRHIGHEDFRSVVVTFLYFICVICMDNCDMYNCRITKNAGSCIESQTKNRDRRHSKEA